MSTKEAEAAVTATDASKKATLAVDVVEERKKASNRRKKLFRREIPGTSPRNKVDTIEKHEMMRKLVSRDFIVTTS